MIHRHIVFDIETTGLNPLKDRITCICTKTDDGGECKFAGDQEKTILTDFLYLFKKDHYVSLISANGRDFDLPFIFIRCLINGINYDDELKKLNDIVHFDVINDITDRRISLNNLARLYGFNVKTGNGLRAIELWKQQKYTELLDYCMDDVKLTENVYKKYLEIKNKKLEEIIND